MRKPIIAALASALAFVPAAVPAQVLEPGRWDVTSTVVDLVVPGAPGFMLRMLRGRSRTEHKCVPAGQGVATLLIPDPKARCGVDGVRIADGRYVQTLSCPQKRGEPLKIGRTGTYDATGFVGRATMAGQTPKGAMKVTLDQRAAHVAGPCRG